MIDVLMIEEDIHGRIQFCLHIIGERVATCVLVSASISQSHQAPPHKLVPPVFLFILVPLIKWHIFTYKFV